MGIDLREVGDLSSVLHEYNQNSPQLEAIFLRV